MKNTKTMNFLCRGKKSFALAIIATMCILPSCEDFMDVHKEYVNEDETIYAPKIDSMVFRAGEGRILFQAWLISSPTVKTIDVYWDGGEKKRSITVPASASDTVLVEEFLPDMGEQSYTFDVRTTDSYGHKSLKTTGSGTSYGEFFRSTLNQRRTNSAIYKEQLSQMEISWGAAADNLAGCELRYTTAGNEQKVVKVNRSESLTTITDIATGSVFEYRSLYLPEPTAVDTFVMDWEGTIDPVVLFDKTSWQVLSVSDHQVNDGGGVNTIIDGIISTSNYWHSSWNPPAPLPHWAIIDMKVPKDITRIETYRATNNAYVKTVQYLVSDTLPNLASATWVQIGSDVVFPNATTPQMLPTEIPSPSSAHTKQFLKINLPDSNVAQNTSVAEIYVYGAW